MTKPIALTCGDPNGVGIDISFMAAQALDDVDFFLIADKNHVSARGDNFVEITSPDGCRTVPKNKLAVLHHPFAQPANLFGEQAENAGDIIKVIERAVEMVNAGQASAICTNPIHKKVLKDGADFAHPGHTEFLAHLAGVEHSVMMLLCSELRVVPVTIHVALDTVSEQLTPHLLQETIEITHKALSTDFGITHPRISVAGLNPHAGEQGTFGREEIDMITPTLDKLRDQGMKINGPMSADTMFHSEARQNYDVAVCMYHDQALIPIKTLDFHGGVNVTLGLPFIRTSPDHGTAFDLAGTDQANPSSLIAALRCAKSMAQMRANHVG